MSENLVEEYLDSIKFFDEEITPSVTSKEDVSMLVGLLAVSSTKFNGESIKSLAQILQSKERTNKDIDRVVRSIAQHAFEMGRFSLKDEYDRGFTDGYEDGYNSAVRNLT